MRRTVIDQDLLPTASDVEFYRRHGYWISGSIVPGEVLDAAERGMERLYAGDVDRQLPDGRRRDGWQPEDGDVLRKNDYSSLLVDELAAVVRLPIIAACAARLAGAEEIRLWHDQLLYKPPQGDAATPVNVGWHTDRQYWRTCSSTEMLTAWVPFHDVDETTGSITFVDGSHVWENDIPLSFFDSDLATLEPLRDRHDVQLVPAQIPRGAMSFHHCRTIHGSGPNRSRVPRRSIAIHLQPGDNEYVAGRRPDGKLVRHGLDDLVGCTAAGTPDYEDPDMCPVLWT